jgi:hypothetical protein
LKAFPQKEKNNSIGLTIRDPTLLPPPEELRKKNNRERKEGKRYKILLIADHCMVKKSENF